jgi:hypothetical protein
MISMPIQKFNETFCKTLKQRCWLHGSWIYNYLRKQCLSPLVLWVQIPLRQGVLDTTLCDTVCQWLAAGQRFSPGNPVSSINKTDLHDITEILLKVRLNTITLSLTHINSFTSVMEIPQNLAWLHNTIWKFILCSDNLIGLYLKKLTNKTKDFLLYLY